jgi:hypothetical protein
VVNAPGRANIHWDPAFRIIATRFPAVDLWAGLDPALWDRLDQVEAMTNPRLSAPQNGSSYIHWPFDNPRPGRFSTGTLGAFYAARDERGAVAETVHYQAIRCREDDLNPHEFDMRVLAVAIEGQFHDLRKKRADAFPGVMDPDSHAAAQALAMDLRAKGSLGILFSSVRDAENGPCVAAFDAATVKRCSHLRFLTYRWDGVKVEPLYEKRPLS